MSCFVTSQRWRRDDLGELRLRCACQHGLFLLMQTGSGDEVGPVFISEGQGVGMEEDELVGF